MLPRQEHPLACVCRKARVEGRAGLPDRNDRAWFSSTFCSGADLGGLGESSSIWPYITGFPIYGPLALLAAQPLTLGRFFEVRTKIVGNAEHLVVGTSEDETGVRDSRALRAFVMDALRYALSESLTHALSTAAAISERKDEPEWMRDLRLRAFKAYERRPMPNWGSDLSGIAFDDI